MEFRHGGNWCKLQGDKEAVQVMDSKEVTKLSSKGNATYLLQCWLVHVEELPKGDKANGFIHPELLDLTDEYHRKVGQTSNAFRIL